VLPGCVATNSFHMLRCYADPDLSGKPPQDLSPTGICRSNATYEWEVMTLWNLLSGLGMGSTWNLGK